MTYPMPGQIFHDIRRPGLRGRPAVWTCNPGVLGALNHERLPADRTHAEAHRGPLGAQRAIPSHHTITNTTSPPIIGYTPSPLVGAPAATPGVSGGGATG